jgi:hypothetical protein
MPALAPIGHDFGSEAVEAAQEFAASHGDISTYLMIFWRIIGTCSDLLRVQNDGSSRTAAAADRRLSWTAVQGIS